MEENKDLQMLSNYASNVLKSKTKSTIFKVLKKTFPVTGFFLLIILIVLLIGSALDSIKFLKIFKDKIVEDEYQDSGVISKEKIEKYIQIEKDNNKTVENVFETQKVFINDLLIETSTKEITINIDTYGQKLYWQLLAAMDIVCGFDKEDNTIEKLSKNIKPIYKTKRYNQIITYTTPVDNKIKKVVTTRPQIVVEEIKTIFFDIKFSYNNVKTDEGLDCYVLSGMTKEINNNFENLLQDEKLQNKVSIKDIDTLYEFGKAFPNSEDFEANMYEYMALNNNINIKYREYDGDGNYDVADDKKEYRVPINAKKLNITSPFGERYITISGVTQKNFHRGIDIAVPQGTAILASKGGTITKAYWHESYGNFIEVKHDSTYSTIYAHLSRILIKKGDTVKKGEMIALSGNTGVSTGPHLHFEIKQNNNPINPMNYLNIK